jgi:predicted site-specific integrase-resolvase
MRTKELCDKTGVSEATLRRWLRERTIPELADAPEDWRGWREWEEQHVDAIRRYQEQKKQQRKSKERTPRSSQLDLPLNNSPRRPGGG